MSDKEFNAVYGVSFGLALERDRIASKYEVLRERVIRVSMIAGITGLLVILAAAAW